MMIRPFIDDLVCRPWNVFKEYRGQQTRGGKCILSIQEHLKRKKPHSSFPRRHICRFGHWHGRQHPKNGQHEPQFVLLHVCWTNDGGDESKNSCFPSPGQVYMKAFRMTTAQTYMIHCSSPTSPPDKRDIRSRAQRLKIYLLPWILVPAYYDTRFIAIYEQQWFFRFFVPEQPYDLFRRSVYAEC